MAERGPTKFRHFPSVAANGGEYLPSREIEAMAQNICDLIAILHERLKAQGDIAWLSDIPCEEVGIKANSLSFKLGASK